MSYPKAAKELNLTDEEERAVQDTWAVLAQDLRGAGVRFFIHLFTLYPKYQPLFRSFATVPLDELAENRRFKAHGFTVFSAINGYVEAMDDIEMLRELLLKTGSNHARHKLTPADFEIVKDVLLSFFKKELGDELTPIAADSWTKLLTIVVKVINEGIEEYNQEHGK